MCRFGGVKVVLFENDSTDDTVPIIKDSQRQVASLFFITLKPRVEWYTKSMRLKFEPASEPLHISVKQLRFRE